MNHPFWRELTTDNIKEADVIICGIPFDGATSCGKGAAMAPAMFRELSGFLPPVSYNGSILTNKIYDLGDVECFDPSNPDSKITDAIASNAFAFFIGGDHSVSITTQSAFIKQHQGKKIGLIHCDAHADLCDVYDDNHYSHASVNRRTLEAGLSNDDFVMIGLRSWEVQEVVFLNENKSIVSYPMVELRKRGLQAIVDAVIEKFKDYDAVYLSFDIDCIDPAYAPGTGTPEMGGLTNFQAMDLISELVLHLPIQAMDIVEVSPPLDCNQMTTWLALKLIYEVLYCLNRKKNGGTR